MPTLWIMANSRLRDTMAVTIELMKFNTPTSAMMMLMAFPMTAEERVSLSYCSAIVFLEATGRLLSSCSV